MRMVVRIGVLLTIFLMSSCSSLSSPDAFPGLGAGFRYSTYGAPAQELPTNYWLDVGQKMAARFDGAIPETIWIVGNYSGAGPQFTFPGSHEDFNIHFSMKDNNETALELFDQQGVRVWLQVEPGDVDMNELIKIILERYGHHRSVIGVGVDVEWYHSDGTPEGEQVTDEEAANWVKTVRSYNPNYRLFLKHWEVEKMPPTYRDGLTFIDDSQGFASLDQMVDEFTAWGLAFPDSPVGFQFGYPADKFWWSQLSDPPGEIGNAILENVPNTSGLYWVDFGILDVFPVE